MREKARESERERRRAREREREQELGKITNGESRGHCSIMGKRGKNEKHV